jgi:hypothetical protein
MSSMVRCQLTGEEEEEEAADDDIDDGIWT